MGAWGWELLENDSAADEIGDVMAEIAHDAVVACQKPLTRERAGVFAAQLALLSRYAPWSFKDDDRAAALRTGIQTNRAALALVAPRSETLLDALERGPLPDDASVDALLGAKHARRYLQRLADTALEKTQDKLDEPTAGAHLHLLVTLSPHVELSRKTVRHLLHRLRDIVEDADDEAAAQLRSYVKACKTLAERAVDVDDGDDE